MGLEGVSLLSQHRGLFSKAFYSKVQTDRDSILYYCTFVVVSLIVYHMISTSTVYPMTVCQDDESNPHP